MGGITGCGGPLHAGVQEGVCRPDRTQGQAVQLSGSGGNERKSLKQLGVTNCLYYNLLRSKASCSDADGAEQLRLT